MPSSTMKHADAFGLRRKNCDPRRELWWRKTGFEAHNLTDDGFTAFDLALKGAEAGCQFAAAVVRLPFYSGVQVPGAVAPVGTRPWRPSGAEGTAGPVR